MNGISLKEFEKYLNERWSGCEIEIRKYTETEVVFGLSKMYDYPNLGFKDLMGLAELFDTMEIDDADRDHTSGCETCDYGSNYEVTLRITKNVT